MKKLTFVLIMFACTCIGGVSVAEAACLVPYPNIVGVWRFTDAKSVNWNGGTGQYTYESGISGTISIDSQQEGLFYGTFQTDGENPVPITGTVYYTSVLATDADQDIITGTLFQCNTSTNSYAKLRFRTNEVLDISLTPSGTLAAGMGIATRQAGLNSLKEGQVEDDGDKDLEELPKVPEDVELKDEINLDIKPEKKETPKR